MNAPKNTPGTMARLFDAARRLSRRVAGPAGRCAPTTRRGGRAGCGERAGRGERGMVTVELAVSILTAALIAAGLCWVIGVVGTQIRCQDAAMAIARQLARGDESGAERARESVPSGASVQVSDDGEAVQVTISDELSWGRLGPVPVNGRATVTKEPHAVEQRS